MAIKKASDFISAAPAPARSMKDAFKTGEIKAFTLRMDSDLHYRLKLQALEEGRTMTDILDDLARGYLDGKKS